MLIVASVEALVWLAESAIVAAIYHAYLPIAWGFVLCLNDAGLILGVREPSLTNISRAIGECEIFRVIFRFYEAEIAILGLKYF